MHAALLRRLQAAVVQRLVRAPGATLAELHARLARLLTPTDLWV